MRSAFEIMGILECPSDVTCSKNQEFLVLETQGRGKCGMMSSTVLGCHVNFRPHQPTPVCGKGRSTSKCGQA